MKNLLLVFLLFLARAGLQAEAGVLMAIYGDLQDGKAWAREWKDGQPHRLAHGVKAWALYQDPRNAAKVWVFYQSVDLSDTAKALRERWSSVQLWLARDLDAKKMLRPKVRKGKGRHAAGIVVVRHRVNDVAEWRKRFKANTHRHAKRGYVPSQRSLHQDASDPAILYVTHDASDIDVAMGYMSKPEMAANMKAAGVQGEAEYLFGRWVESGLAP